ncbi:MAG: WG repeat-containing protein [Candidatus Marinimicrobia bacterium]|nr:WG repeat-containing protein [Candidatus Neomarinimicrobiota bacterium]
MLLKGSIKLPKREERILKFFNNNSSPQIHNDRPALDISRPLQSWKKQSGLIFRGMMMGLLITANLFGQQNDWYRRCDSADNCGYVDKKGNFMVPPGKYERCLTDTFRSYAIVSFRDKPDLVGIDKEGNILFTVFPYDNGPDYISEGTFRVTENTKIGFADTTGTIIIPPIYDFAFKFEKGLALVNIGGHRVSSNPADPDCEYYTWTGGHWGVIDKNGKVVLDINYHYNPDPASQKTELIGEDEKFIIEKGQIYKAKK